MFNELEKGMLGNVKTEIKAVPRIHDPKKWEKYSLRIRLGNLDEREVIMFQRLCIRKLRRAGVFVASVPAGKETKRDGSG